MKSSRRSHGVTGKGWCDYDSLKIYASHLLSSWGDRMWAFAVGLYLIILYPKSLQVTAIYGLSVCISMIIFGATIGKWIDKTKRITVAQVALIVQNSAVVCCSIILICLLYYKSNLESTHSSVGKSAMIVGVIVLAVIANLGSEASKIALEKDWIVVLSGGDEVKLANMNATMRSIDLATFILAPILVGQIITYGSQIAGALFIACWNIFSGFCEYFLLTNIYKRVPQLSKKTVPLICIEPPKDSPNSAQNDTYLATDRIDADLSFDNLTEVSLASPATNRSWNPFLNRVHPETNVHKRSTWAKCWTGLKNRCRESFTGWKDYFAHPVRGAGIGLALLYMTVLGFDSITTGYAYSQGVSESLLGIMTAMGALFGILGSISFPLLRKKLGKCRTGILGFGLETLCLILCLVSIVAPGSPFVHKTYLISSTTNVTTTEAQATASVGYTRLTPIQLWNERTSVILLMTGIICARYGLWIADLSVIQIFQEEIPADQRGVLNGVQASLNQGMNLLKFILVIVLPHPETFAYLIALSWIFVFTGCISFIIFTCRFRSYNQDRADNTSVESSSVGSQKGHDKDDHEINNN